MSNEFSGMSAPMEADDNFRDPPKWPKVVGIISIVLASIGLLCNGAAGVGLVFSSSLSGMIEEAAQQDPAAAMPPVMFQPSAMTVAATLLAVVGAVLLLIAGIMTVTRRALGRPLHLLYAVASLVVLGLTIVATLAQIDAIQAWVAENPDTNFARAYTPAQTLIGIGIAVLMNGVYPLFCLVWFGAMGKKPEVDAPEYL